MPTTIAFLVYLASAWLILHGLRRQPERRAIAFGLINVVAFAAMVQQLYGMAPQAVAIYLAIIVCQYGLLVQAEKRGRFLPPMLFPVLIMLVAKVHSGWALVGISYLAFRLSYLALELRDKSIRRPGFWLYMAYACFPPLTAVGPITTMKVFSASLTEPDSKATPVGRAALRIIVGLLKFKVFAALYYTVSPQVLLMDSYRHGWLDLVTSSALYYGYLYCNFSGYTDIVIGMAGLLGIAVEENFDRPYLARNIQEFWQRWHITLARYMRDMVYFPMVKALGRRYGRARYNHVVVVAILVTFVLTGLWHGFARNFFYYGLLHAAGLIVHFLYGLMLKKRLGPRVNSYNDNPYIRAAATALTFSYLCFTFQFFANDMKSLHLMMKVLH